MINVDAGGNQCAVQKRCHVSGTWLICDFGHRAQSLVAIFLGVSIE